MSLAPISLVNIVVDVVLLISALALAVIMVWQNPRLRGRAFAVCMLAFATYALGDLLWKLARPLGYAPRPPLELATIAYGVGVMLLTVFALAFAKVPDHIRNRVLIFVVPTGGALLALGAAGMFYQDFEPLSTGTYGHRMTDLGRASALIAVAYLGVAAMLLRRNRGARSRALAPPMALMAAGVLLHTLAVPLHIYAFNVVAVTVAIIWVGRALVRYEVFKPLADLNAALIVKNSDLQEAARLKSQFLANMTHELRTPLNSIIGYTDMIGAGVYGELNARQADRIARVNRNGLHLLDLINDVLDLSKIEAGRLELSRSRVAISPLIETVCVEVGPQAEAKGLRLIRLVPPDLPPIWADQMRVHQILDKLLANAINFTDQGTITVSGALDPAQNEIVIGVADTGAGVEPAQRPHVFEAFMPGLNRQADRRKGAGLGLAIAYRLAALHGGRLWYDTVLGAGSTFYVALPALADKTATVERPRVPLQEGRA